MQNLHDQQLVFSVSAYHDHEAFQELYRRYDKKIFDFVRFKISRKEDVEDISSQVFLGIWEHLTSGGVKDIQYFRAFIYKVAKNNVAGFYRTQGKAPPVIALDKPGEYGDYQDVEDIHADVFIKQVRAQDVDYLIECVQKMPEPYKEVVTLRFFEELDIQEIAEIIEKTEGNVRVLIHRGVDALKKVMLSDKNHYDLKGI